MKNLRHWLFGIGSTLTALSIVAVILAWGIVTGFFYQFVSLPPSWYLFGRWCYTWWWVPEAIGISCLILWGLLFRFASPPETRTRKRRRGGAHG
jgi:hypothetical protein